MQVKHELKDLRPEEKLIVATHCGGGLEPCGTSRNFEGPADTILTAIAKFVQDHFDETVDENGYGHWGYVARVTRNGEPVNPYQIDSVVYRSDGFTEGEPEIVIGYLGSDCC
jgi:hypothetical protein